MLIDLVGLEMVRYMLHEVILIAPRQNRRQRDYTKSSVVLDIQDVIPPGFKFPLSRNTSVKFYPGPGQIWRHKVDLASGGIPRTPHCGSPRLASYFSLCKTNSFPFGLALSIKSFFSSKQLPFGARATLSSSH